MATSPDRATPPEAFDFDSDWEGEPSVDDGSVWTAIRLTDDPEPAHSRSWRFPGLKQVLGSRAAQPRAPAPAPRLTAWQTVAPSRELLFDEVSSTGEYGDLLTGAARATAAACSTAHVMAASSATSLSSEAPAFMPGLE